MIGGFALSIFLSKELSDKKDQLEIRNEQLRSSRDSVSQKNEELDSLLIVLDSTRLSLQETISELVLAQESNAETVALRLKRKANAKFSLGVTAQAKNAEYSSLNAFFIGQGYKLSWINQDRSGSFGSPKIYYYSESAKEKAEELKKEIESKFGNKIIEIDEPKLGGSTHKYKANEILVYLKFNY